MFEDYLKLTHFVQFGITIVGSAKSFETYVFKKFNLWNEYKRKK